MRNTFTYSNQNFNLNNLLSYSKKFSYSSILLSNKIEDKYSQYQTVVCLGSKKTISSDKNSLNKLRNFHDKYKDWMFGFLSYDLKNEIENLNSENKDNFHVPNIFFFIPQTILFISNNELKVETFLSKNEIDKIIDDIKNKIDFDEKDNSVELQFTEGKESYIQKIRKIKEHIQRGDIYEMNYCQELYSQGTEINPEKVFLELNNSSKAPFSAYFKYKDKYLLCSSPERFLQKSGNRIISQPIKGTRKRGIDLDEDRFLFNELKNSKKDKSENVMITDLVRNDLSKTAQKSSVKVEELFGVYSFETVHQMITTISSIIDKKYDFVDLIESCFPMGSMTGAPKLKAMQLIEEYETTKRSIYSGAFGYISPYQDFDFNVVIRSILYDRISSYISVLVGGAITINSDEEQEYEECLIKAQALINVLKNER
tara:strand:- start:7660 stop:8940 length:1281 start_codon:yes stop_codon:yes gene_type:complete